MMEIVKIDDVFNLQEIDDKKITRLENELLAMPQADIKTEHKFYDGFYERKITIPPWTVLTGAEHLTDYSVRLEKGTIAVTTDDGVKVLTAPIEFNAKAGIRRVGRVLGEEVIWIDIYPNEDNCEDLDVIEKRIYNLENCELGENKVNRLIQEDREDYKLFISQIGMTQDLMDAIVKTENDLIPMPDGFYVELRDSKINGKGLFALRKFEVNEFICPGRIDGKRTPAGRFINHSIRPNAKGVKNGDDINAIAIRRIFENEEILIDYRDSMKVNFDIDIQGVVPCLVG